MFSFNDWTNVWTYLTDIIEFKVIILEIILSTSSNQSTHKNQLIERILLKEVLEGKVYNFYEDWLILRYSFYQWLGVHRGNINFLE